MTLLARLRAGDGAAFITLVDSHAASMLRVARLHVSSDAVAQEVVAETAALVRDAMAAPPPMQRIVMIMRDLEGWEAPEICTALDISEGNQRVLLHRARSRVRAALAAAFAAWAASR